MSFQQIILADLICDTMCVHFHSTCFIWLSVLIVEHQVWKTLGHKELLHAINL